MSDPSAKPRASSDENTALAAVIWGDERQGLRHLLNGEQQQVGPLVGYAVAAFTLALVLGAAHVARIGEVEARVLALGLLLIAALVAGIRAYWLRRTRGDAKLAILRTLGAVDKSLGERALRALALLSQAEVDSSVGSRELARRHFERILGRTSSAEVEQAARTSVRRYRLLMWPGLIACAVLALGVSWRAGGIVLDPARVLEGFNVLLARGGRAPVAMSWLAHAGQEGTSAAQIWVKPPLYLREPGSSMAFGDRSAAPKGSEITVRGQALRPARTLILTDGQREVEFVDDGLGSVVAHWILEGSTALFVAARFGTVRVYEAVPLTLEAEPDSIPKVDLEGAPRTLKLLDVERVELRYRVSDDHGLRQLDLVLRSAGKEERRTLARLDGQTKKEWGGHALAQNDSFLRRLFLPVVITIEARDNEPLSSDRWGKSEAITLVPPPVGSNQVERLDVLLRARNALTEFLAWQLHAQRSKSEARLDQMTRLAALEAEVSAALLHTQGINPGVRAFISTQVTGLTQLPHSELQSGTEQALLSVDMLARRLALEDARFVAKQLADVAKELALAAQQAQLPEGSAGSALRFDGAARVLEEGGKKLTQLLELGHDLGTLTLSELDRIRRARNKDDFFHAELAARHLALRLSRPNPSFGSAGGGGGGVESGQGNQSSASSETSKADQKFDQWAAELERLAMEHAREIDSVERTLKDADTGSNSEQFRPEASARAEAIRQLVEDLPEVGAAPETAEAALALAHEYARSMAQNLERLAFENAVESGRDSLSSLRDTERRRRVESGNYSLPPEEQLRTTEQKLKEHLAWAEKTLENLKNKAAMQAQGPLEGSAQREQELGRWAEQLERQGQEKGAGISQQSLDGIGKAEQLMRQAEAALREGRGENGRDLQLEAQRYLEQASTGTTQADNQGGEAGSKPHEGEVPKAERRRQAEEFRKRVLEGLGQSSGGKLGPAVKRYAEGLLQ